MGRFWIRLVSLVVFSLCSQANSMVFSTLTEGILGSFNYPELVSGASVPLRSLEGVLGYVCVFDENIVIQLNGISQQTNMSCGVMTFVNALILRDIPFYPAVQDQLTNLQAIANGAGRLKTLVVEKLKKIYGEANWEYERITQEEGLSIDMLARALSPEGNIVVGVDEGSELFYFDQSTFGLKKVVQFSFPSIYIIRIGSLIGAGHWIAARFERLPDGRVGIVFVDSCPFRRENGEVVEVVNKIDAYKSFFHNLFKQIPYELSSYREMIGLSENAQKELVDLITAIVSRSLPGVVNEYLGTLRLFDNRFEYVGNLNIIQNESENDRRRIALIKKIALVTPAAKEKVLEKLFELPQFELSQFELSQKEKLLVVEIINNLIED